MTAIEIEGGKGAAEALKPTVAERPVPGPGQVLIKVEAAGVNRPDLLQRLGFYPPPPGAPTTLGLEVAGEVALGWRPGAGRSATRSAPCWAAAAMPNTP
jgi:NADPH2:quinone reductase